MKVETIISIVCNEFNIEPWLIQLKSRKKEIKEPRQICHFFVKEYRPDLTLDCIGNQIGHKDHATVIHSCNVVNNLMDTEREYRGKINRIESKLMIEAMRGVLPKYTMNSYQERKQLILN